MQISFTEKKNIRKSFGKLKESLSIPNLIEVQKNSYKELTDFNAETELTKGFDRVFKSIFDHVKDFLLKTLEYYKEKMFLRLFGNYCYLLLSLKVLTNFLSFH